MIRWGKDGGPGGITGFGIAVALLVVAVTLTLILAGCPAP